MNINFNCPVCSEPCNIDESNIHNLKIECARCGVFNFTDTAQHHFNNIDDPNKVVYVSYWIKKNQSTSNPPSIDLVTLKRILESVLLPKPAEQVNNLIIWLGDNQTTISTGPRILYKNLISIVGCYNENDVKLIVKHLEKNDVIKLIEAGSIAVSNLLARLTFTGWEKYYELKTTSKDSKLAFMAMKFANDTLANIFNNIIKDAVSKTGFDIRRLDEEKRAGLIDDKLRVEIRRSKFLIADLTDDNNGAYWEAGYAEGLGMHVIYICEESKFDQRATHFDTNHHLTIKWKDHPESLQKFSVELKATIRATFPTEAKMED